MATVADLPEAVRENEEVVPGNAVSTWVLPSGVVVGRQVVRERRSSAPPKDTTMQFTSEQRLDDDVLEREFTLGEMPGTLWTPGSEPAPLILRAHDNGLPKAEPRLVARARYTAARGYAVATIDAAECGDRPRSAADEQARADLRRAMQAGEPVDEIFESFIGPPAFWGFSVGAG